MLETGVVAFGFASEGIDFLERDTLAVNRKSVIVGNGNIFCTAFVFLTVVPIFMVTGAGEGFGLSERTAVFLPCPSIFAEFTVRIAYYTMVYVLFFCYFNVVKKIKSKCP